MAYRLTVLTGDTLLLDDVGIWSSENATLQEIATLTAAPPGSHHAIDPLRLIAEAVAEVLGPGAKITPVKHRFPLRPPKGAIP